MAQLAIKGHATRGKEVIAILEMLGGINVYDWKSDDEDSYYCIGADYDGEENVIIPIEDGHPNHIYFTLEEFLEKFPYKIGDKVLLEDVVKTIKRVCWDNTENEVIYKIETNVRGFSEEYYVHHYDLQPHKEETMEEIKVDIPKGYEFTGVDDNNQQVVFTKIQPQYPKTYEECCEIMGIEYPVVGGKPDGLSASTYRITEIRPFIYLLICRDAYWKIDGEQMELGKPWEPDWENTETDKYVIEIVKNTITIHDYPWNETNHLLAFPTKGMRDAFYENFKDLITECKGLL